MGRKWQRQNKKIFPAAPPRGEIATTTGGRDITRGLVHGMLPPQDEILLLKGRGDHKIFEAILSDAQVFAAFQRRRLAAVGLERDVLPGGTKRLDQQAAEHLKTQVDPWWDRVVDKHLYCVFYGISFAELMYGIDRDHRYIISDVRVRNRRRFRFWEDMTPRLITSQNMIEGEPLPDCKFWNLSAGADNDDEPYGRGLAHYLYWPVWLKRNGMRFWAIFLEKFGQPTVVGKYHPGATQEEQKKLLAVCEAIRIKTGVVLPEGMMVEFLEASRGGTGDYQTFMAQMNAAISKIILGHGAAADSTPGKLGGEDNAEGVARSILKADADLICSSFNAGPARWLTDWNFKGAAYPAIWMTAEDEEDLNRRVRRDEALLKMGYPLTPEAVEEIYGSYYVLPHGDGDGDGDAPPLRVGQIQSMIQLLLSGKDLPPETLASALLLMLPDADESRIRAMVEPIAEAAAKEQAQQPDWSAQLNDQSEPTDATDEPETPSLNLAEGCTPCDIKDALQLYYLSADPAEFAEFWDGMVVDFAGKRKCIKGYNCGGSCISRNKKCNKALAGEARNYAEWLDKQALSRGSGDGGAGGGGSATPQIDRKDYRSMIGGGEAFVARRLQENVARIESLNKQLGERVTEMLKAKGAARDQLMEQAQDISADLETARSGKENAFALIREDLRKYQQDKGYSADDARQAVEKLENVALYDGTRRLTQEELDQALPAIQDVYELSGGKGSKSLKYLLKRGDRASANKEGVVNIGGASKRSLFHEVTHHMEFESEDLYDAAEAWVRSRATSDTPRSLAEMTGNSGYEANETALPDHFVDPYVGKLYPSIKASEVWTMAVQHFESPQKMKELYKADPEMFHLAVGMLLS